MRTRLSLLSACALLAFALVTSAGCSAFSGGTAERTSSSSGVAAVAPSAGYDAQNAPATSGSSAEKGTTRDGSTAPADRLVITNAAMSLRVDDLAATVASLRALTQQAGGSVSQLTVNDNSESPAADASASNSSAVRYTGPATASLTIRVPAKSLPDVQTKVAALGKLLSQSADESDVTQQHIDMSARLKNLRAEEVRLRDLLNRAGKVSDLLAVERELSRVRGEIESMAAQLAYLEGQAALATLTVALEQPGPVVRPSTGGWGLIDAVTRGVQGAALLVRELITALLALSPLLLIGGLVWWLIARRARKRRAARDLLAEQVPATSSATGAAASLDTESPEVAPSDPEPRT
jgi:hypothetical protein